MTHGTVTIPDRVVPVLDVLENAWQGHVLHWVAGFLPLWVLPSMSPLCCILLSYRSHGEVGAYLTFLASLLARCGALLSLLTSHTPLAPSPRDISSHHMITRGLLNGLHCVCLPGKVRRKAEDAKAQRQPFFQPSFDFLFRNGSSPQNISPTFRWPDLGPLAPSN